MVLTREHWVCQQCGLVSGDIIYEVDNLPKRRSKPYNPNHHFSERMAALLLIGPEIKDKLFLDRFEETIPECEQTLESRMFWGPGKFSQAIKKVDAKFQTEYAKKKYHERYIWMRKYYGIEDPPILDPELIRRLRIRYRYAYMAFTIIKFDKRWRGKKRNNIININFIIINCLKQENALEFARFFSDVKGLKTNYQTLVDYWKAMCYVVKKLYAKNFPEIRWTLDYVNPEEIRKIKFYD
jgi:hypothetical protein